MVSAGGRKPARPWLRPARARNPHWGAHGSAVSRAEGRNLALWVLPVIAGAVLALLVALLTARVGYAGTVLSEVYYATDWTADPEDFRVLANGQDLGYTTKNYVRLAVYAAEPLLSLRIGTLTLPVAQKDVDFTVTDSVYRYPASDKYAVAVLRPGKNTVTVTARGARLTESLKFYVTYVAACVEGAEHYVVDVGATRQVTAFDKALQFNTPAGTVVLDSTGQPAEDQSGRWVVYEPPRDEDDLPPGFRPVSNVFGLEFAGNHYTLSAEPTLVLKYEPNVSPTTAAQMLTVFASDNANDFSSAENLSGVVDTRGGTITVKLDKDCADRYYCVFLGIQNFEEFLNGPEDVAWSFAYVMPLWAKGIMEPQVDVYECVWDYKDLPGESYFGLVHKDSTEVDISRGEFTVMMAKAMGYRPVDMNPLVDSEYSFEDVYSGSNGFANDADRKKYGVWIETAARNGLVNGFPSNPDTADERPEFRMKDGLAREQAAAILARAAGLTLSDDRQAVDNALSRAFADWQSISAWARPYVLAAYRAKYIEGVPVTTPEGKTVYEFRGQQDLTRAQAAKLVYFLAKKNKKL